MKTLFLTLILSPLAFAQTNPGKSPPPSPPAALPLIRNQYTSANMRPEKIAGFKAREAELNRRSIALAEEERLSNIKATKEKELKAKYSHSSPNPGTVGSIPTGPGTDLKHLQRLKALRDEMSIFQRDVLEEIKIKNQQAATAEENRKVIALKQSNQAATPAVGAVTQSPTPTPKPAEVLPVGKAVPSSVPGLPAGLEPTKQKSNLPPGFSRN
ncbi:MAG: hypothetical protein V4819_09475 [Verrucomicrobiota bacterium]